MAKPFNTVVVLADAATFATVWNVTPPKPSAAAAQSDVHYAGCDAVRAAGRAPLYAGEPGYDIRMDGDRDGIACEPRRY